MRYELFDGLILRSMWRPLTLVAVLVGLSALAMGWLHTASARPWLQALGMPCLAGTASAAQVNALRAQGIRSLRGQEKAPARRALGLALDKTTLSQAAIWLGERGMNCDAIQRGLQWLRCRGGTASVLGLTGPAISELWLSFAQDQTLASVDVYWRGLSPVQLPGLWQNATTGLAQALGTPGLAFGNPDPASLLAFSLQTARVQYRFSDYIATLTASNLPHAGLAFRRQFLSTKIDS